MFEDDVRDGSAKAERVHGRASRRAGVRPCVLTLHDLQLQSIEVDRRVGRLEVEVRRYLSVFEAEGRLDQPSDTGGRVQMANVGLDRSEQDRTAIRIPGLGKDPA